MSSKTMFVELSRAGVEHEVQTVFETGFKKAFPNLIIEHSLAGNCQTDGYFEIKLSDGRARYVLTEYKYDKDMSDWYERAEVVSQTIYYINHLLLIGKQRPDAVFIADKNEWFVLDVRKLEKFFTRTDINWNIAPSSAPSNTAFCLEISNDEYIRAIDVHTIDKNFNFDDIIKGIINICKNIVPAKYAVDAKTIIEAYGRFKNCINANIESKESVKLFVKTLIEPDSTHQDEVQKARLVTETGNLIPIHRLAFSAFSERYVKEYTEDEKKSLTEIADRIIKEEDRRKSGDFWTPTNFVDYAHGQMEKVFGNNWRDVDVVWDCCCGTKNLTRDYDFKELYCSTLFQSELDMAKKYNREATTFQFDFLNDDFEKLPEGLKNAFREKKSIRFLINPPYATACNHGKTSKESLAQTMVNKWMKADDIGSCSENLLSQFFYRIMKLKERFGCDISIGVFCKPIFLSGATYDKFREKFLSQFKYEGGFLFNAGHFSGTSEAWGIDFTCWSSGETTDKNNFNHTLVDTDRNGQIKEVGSKVIYNCDGSQLMSKWVETKDTYEQVDAVPLTSGVCVRLDGKERGKKLGIGSIGYFHSNANSVCYNAQYVNIFTSVFAAANGRDIRPENFLRVCSAFAVRKLIGGNWINDKDEYLAPDETNPKFRQFELDAVIYSLFNSSSQQSSLHNIEYKGKTWDIPNHFFWMSREEIMNLAKENENEEVYNDANASEDRFVYKFIQDVFAKGEHFSLEAKAVLDKGFELVRKTFKYRWLFNQDNPTYQTNNWDCGYYQLKNLLKKDVEAKNNGELKNFCEEFETAYKVLAEKLRPQVYELGFLKK